MTTAIITFIAGNLSDCSRLSMALPSQGVLSVTAVEPVFCERRAAESGAHRRFRSARRFAPNYRMEVVVDDDAVEQVLYGIDVVYGAGLISEIEVWVHSPAPALSA